MIAAVEELRPVTALRLLRIRQEEVAAGRAEWELAALCNARVLAECCFSGGERMFADGQAVLEAMTFREMETLLRQLSGGDALPAAAAVNPAFDGRRYAALRER